MGLIKETTKEGLNYLKVNWKNLTIFIVILLIIYFLFILGWKLFIQYVT